MLNPRHRQHMNQYQQGLLSGQYNPLHAMIQGRQRQMFSPTPWMVEPRQEQEQQQPQQEQGGEPFNQGMKDLMEMMGKGPDLTQQWGNQGSPINTTQQWGQGGSPFQQSGLEMLKMLPTATYAF